MKGQQGQVNQAACVVVLILSAFGDPEWGQHRIPICLGSSNSNCWKAGDGILQAAALLLPPVLQQHPLMLVHIAFAEAHL